jgi:hypothetical protein
MNITLFELLNNLTIYSCQKQQEKKQVRHNDNKVQIQEEKETKEKWWGGGVANTPRTPCFYGHFIPMLYAISTNLWLHSTLFIR